ncbi:MAG: hypothetical protein NVV74_00535 [Magnetospirillum sp.]|nr:hypothetical protein [Magnetospirillum sp.]
MTSKENGMVDARRLPGTLYHATNGEWRDFILQNGLKPTAPHGRLPKILLFLAEEDARSFAATLFGVSPHSACVLAIDATAPESLALQPPESGNGLGPHVYATVEIPADRLALAEPSHGAVPGRE